MSKINSSSAALVLAGMATALAAHAQQPVANPLNWRTAHPTKALDFEPARVPDALCAPNDSTLIITSGIHGNRLYRTTNRGLTWQVSAQAAPAGLKTFFSGQHGVVSYDSSATLPARVRGQLRFTTDGGDAWSAPRAVPMGKAVFLSATEALIFQQRLPGGLVIYRTTNAGLTWAVRDSLSGLPYLSNLISVPSANTAYMFVGDTVARQMIQIGLGRHTWRAYSLPSATNVYTTEVREVHFSTDSSGLARDVSAFDQRIFATTNGGRTWLAKPMPSMTGGVNNSFALLDAQHLLAHDDFPTQASDMLKLSANGQSWENIPMPDYTSAPNGPGDPYQMLGLQSSYANSYHAPMVLRPSGVGWTVGGGGRIWYSADFGATWTLRSDVMQADEVIAFNFPDPGHGYVAARADAIIRTLDQGQTWTRLPNTPTVDLVSAAAFPDADTLFLATQGVLTTATIYRSTDGGQTWASAAGAPTNNLLTLAFFEGARRGLATGRRGTIVRTTDGGQTWIAGTSGTTDDLLQLAWASAQTAFVTSRTNVFKSTDAGATWQPLTTRPSAATYGAISFPTPTLGFLRADSKMFRTTDGGTTWTALAGTHQGSQIRFISASVGWTNEQVTLDSGQTWTALARKMWGFPAPIDADNSYTATTLGQGPSAGPTVRVTRYSKHFLRAAPLAQTTLTTGASLNVAFTTEGPFTPAERDFRVELSNEFGRFRSGQTTLIGQGTASPISVTLPANLPPGTRYRLRVVRADRSVLGADNGQNLTIQRPTGLAPEADVLAAPQLYPNPAQQTVSVRFTDGAQAGRQVRLLDLTGRVVLVQPAPAPEAQLSLHGLGAGCYLLEVRAPGGRRHSQRLMVQP